MRRDLGLRVLVASTWLTLGACSDDGTGASGSATDSGTGTTGGTPGTTGEPTTGTVPTTGSATTEVLTGSGTTGPGCPGAENACGGCEPLSQEPGTPCNGCDQNTWTCDGPDAVVCAGNDPDAQPYYPDQDGDGHGAAGAPPTWSCEPVPGHVPGSNDDCDDSDPGVHPGGKEVCNGVDDDCNQQVDEPPPGTFCTDACCDVEQVCQGAGGCAPKCSDGEICGANLELCCAPGESCVGNTCVVPGNDCEFDEECGADEICPGYLGKCVPAGALPTCEFIPEFGPFKPVQACRWTADGLQVNPGRRDIVATPIVLNLTDDNGDGLTDDNDIPDIAFMTYNLSGNGCCNVPGTLRIVSGQCNEDKTMTTLASINTPQLTNDVGIAGGDLDNDGVPELVAVGLVGSNPVGTVAFRRVTPDGTQWEVFWHNTMYPSNQHTRGAPTISIADLDADLEPEVIIGNVVLDGLTGALEWDGRVTSNGTGGIGNNGFLGPASTVADIDLDGFQEVIAGNTVYAHDGTVVWTFPYMTQNSPCGGALPCDGFNAVANFDDDDEAEIVIVRRGEIFVLDTDGTELHRIVLPKIDCANNESGPPTIADFDGDGRREIGTASADYYIVADLDCDVDPVPPGCSDKGILWKVPNQDCSSRVTASSVFDFEGDEKAEVIYADEVSFRIFDGTTGAVLFSDNTYRSHTRLEMPVIADVNRDGHADIVIGENSNAGGMPGLEVWTGELNDWVRTRRVWNQHAYSITNITKDGRIPAVPEYNWLNARFNNFRQNVQPGGLFNAPDATVVGVLCDESMLDKGQVGVSVVVKNDGALELPALTPVHIEIEKDGVVTPILDTATNNLLLPGQFEVLDITFPLPDPAPGFPFIVRAIVDPAGAVDECIEDNNAGVTECIIAG
ncbi:MAG TPA: putative metal-binding motif-containing protein [Nannocystis sp.]